MVDDVDERGLERARADGDVDVEELEPEEARDDGAVDLGEGVVPGRRQVGASVMSGWRQGGVRVGCEEARDDGASGEVTMTSEVDLRFS